MGPVESPGRESATDDKCREVQMIAMSSATPLQYWPPWIARFVSGQVHPHYVRKSGASARRGDPRRPGHGSHALESLES
jgi:hypothetical protein